MKAYRQYPSVRTNWDENTRLAVNDPDRYFEGVKEALDGLKPEWFRIHSAGDFFSQDYFNRWVEVIRSYPGVKFLAFTKAFRFVPVYSSLPDNFSLVLSVFRKKQGTTKFKGKTKLTRYIPKRINGYPIAAAGEVEEYQNSMIAEEVKDAVNCPGSCTTCAVCWSLAKKNINVRFSIH